MFCVRDFCKSSVLLFCCDQVYALFSYLRPHYGIAGDIVGIGKYVNDWMLWLVMCLWIERLYKVPCLRREIH